MTSYMNVPSPVTFPSNNIRQTSTISGESITIEMFRVRSQNIADALGANAADGVAPEAGFAELAVGPLRVEKTFEAGAGIWVTVTSVVKTPVVATVAGDARTAGNFWISVIVVSAHGTS